MKFLIVATLAVLFVVSEGRRLEPTQCELGRILIAITGMCPVQDFSTCVDICTGREISDLEECSVTPECCWTRERCTMKMVPSYYNVEKEHKASSENPEGPGETEQEEEKSLSRAKRHHHHQATTQLQERNEVSLSEEESLSREKRQASTAPPKRNEVSVSANGQGKYVRVDGEYRRRNKNSGFTIGGHLTNYGDYGARGSYERRLGRGSIGVSGGYSKFGGSNVGVRYSFPF